MHHGIVAFFEAGGLGQTPMNLHTDRPTEEEGKKKIRRRHTALSSGNRVVKQLKVRGETLGFRCIPASSRLHLFSS